MDELTAAQGFLAETGQTGGGDWYYSLTPSLYSTTEFIKVINNNKCYIRSRWGGGQTRKGTTPGVV